MNEKQLQLMDDAVELERNYWQLVAILAAIFGMLIGAGSIRCGTDQFRDTPVVSPCAVQMVHGKSVDNPVD